MQLWKTLVSMLNQEADHENKERSRYRPYPHEFDDVEKKDIHNAMLHLKAQQRFRAKHHQKNKKEKNLK